MDFTAQLVLAIGVGTWERFKMHRHDIPHVLFCYLYTISSVVHITVSVIDSLPVSRSYFQGHLCSSQPFSDSFCSCFPVVLTYSACLVFFLDLRI